MTPKEYWQMLRTRLRNTAAENAERKPQPHRIPEEVYAELAAQLLQQIGNSNYISGLRATVETEDFDYELIASAVIYWRNIAAPDGNYQELERIVPVWWELHSYEGDDRIECLNDAAFERIHEQIIAL